MPKQIIKVGDKYNYLTAIKFNHRDKWGHQYWLFKCDCGNEKIICVDHIKYGKTKACGCLHKNGGKATTHGMCEIGAYSSWQSMKARCSNKNHLRYKNYGGRGITICDEWLKFENFFKDMGDRPKGKSLDRINNNKGYYKDNCKWSTSKEQSNNMRRNVLITFKNRTQTITQWSEELGIKYHNIRNRLQKGWSIDKILNK